MVGLGVDFWVGSYGRPRCFCPWSRVSGSIDHCTYACYCCSLGRHGTPTTYRYSTFTEVANTLLPNMVAIGYNGERMFGCLPTFASPQLRLPRKLWPVFGL